jgi:short-subunit dehydrogenase
MARGPGSVFITGASDGIGAALARAYAARGWRLGLLARRSDRLEQLASSLPVACEVYSADVRDAAALHDAARHFVETGGAPDVVIANAGVSAGNLTAIAGDVDTCEWILDVNLMGAVRTFQPFIASMQARGRGALVGMASVAGVRGLPGAGAYCASKAALIAYLESLRVELRGTGLNVITLLPGYVDTAMTTGNPYRMPFMLDADDAARRLLRVIDARRPHAVVPWQMGVVAGIMKFLPPALHDLAFARAGRKPRRPPEGV